MIFNKVNLSLVRLVKLAIVSNNIKLLLAICTTGETVQSSLSKNNILVCFLKFRNRGVNLVQSGLENLKVICNEHDVAIKETDLKLMIL